MVLNLKVAFNSKELLRAFLQHVRDFDVAHFDEVLIAMDGKVPELSEDEMMEVLSSIKPPYADQYIVRKKYRRN